MTFPTTLHLNKLFCFLTRYTLFWYESPSIFPVRYNVRLRLFRTTSDWLIAGVVVCLAVLRVLAGKRLLSGSLAGCYPSGSPVGAENCRGGCSFPVSEGCVRDANSPVSPRLQIHNRYPAHDVRTRWPPCGSAECECIAYYNWHSSITYIYIYIYI